MALINCTECGNPVSTKAKACPKCGAPPEQTALVRCAECGNPLSTKAEACPKCGAPPEESATQAAPVVPNPPAPRAKPQLPPLVWEPGNKAQFERWQRFQLDDAKILGCLLKQQAFASLKFPEFWSALPDDNTADPEAGRVAFARQFIASDLSQLSLDFQPTSFEAAFETFAAAVRETVERIGRQVPAVAPLLRGMQFGPDQRTRFCEELASISRREFGNAVSQLGGPQARLRAGRHLLDQGNSTDLASAARSVGAGVAAVAMPWVGVPMLIANIFQEKSREKQTEQQLAELDSAFDTGAHWANEAKDGCLRALDAIEASVCVRYRQFAEILFRSFVESGVGPAVNWGQMCQLHIAQSADAFRVLLEAQPQLRDGLVSLPLDAEILALVPEEPERRDVLSRRPNGDREAYCLHCREFYARTGSMGNDPTNCPRCDRNFHVNATEKRYRVCPTCFDDAYSDLSSECARCKGPLSALWGTLTTTRYENGQVKAEGLVRDGKMEGLWTEWHENGQKAEEGAYKDGKAEGPVTAWHKNGQKAGEGAAKDGELEGLYVTWYENGQKESETTFIGGKPNGIMSVWHENGTKKGEIFLKDGIRAGRAVLWYANGQKRAEATFKDDERDGLLLQWYENGQKKSEVNYRDGRQHGLAIGWHQNGTKSSEVVWANDSQQGFIAEWDESGHKRPDRDRSGIPLAAKPDEDPFLDD